MACQVNGTRCSSAASRNGISGHMSRALNVMSSWRTVNALLAEETSLDSLPAKVANAALGAVGLRLDGGKLRLANVAGLIIATHALEQGTSVVATMLARMALRGKPFGAYRGVILRRNPLTGLAQRAQNRLSGGRVPAVEGFYFHQGGRTWSCRSTQYRISKDTVKTLTAITSLSYPNRAYYFDRKVDERDAVDIVLGDKDPDRVPGFLGSTNEIDALVPALGSGKRALMGLNWLTMDDSERDTRGPDFVDYGTLDRPRANTYGQYGGYSDRYPHLRPSPGPYTCAYTYADLARQADVKKVPVSEGYGGLSAAEEKKPDPGAFVSDLWGNKPGQAGSQPPAPPEAGPADDDFKVVRSVRYEDLVKEVGQPLAPAVVEHETLGQRPLRVEALDQFKDGRILAEAYYEAPDGGWTPILDEKALEQIAGRITDKFQRISKQTG